LVTCPSWKCLCRSDRFGGCHDDGGCHDNNNNNDNTIIIIINNSDDGFYDDDMAETMTSSTTLARGRGDVLPRFIPPTSSIMQFESIMKISNVFLYSLIFKLFNIIAYVISSFMPISNTSFLL